MFVECIGGILARLPERVVERLCRICGWVTYNFVRGDVARRNMARAFPELADTMICRLARESCDRTVEMGMLGIAGSTFSETRWRRIVEIPEAVLEGFSRLQSPEQKKGILLLIPHTTLMEALTALPMLLPGARRTSVLYRALDSDGLNRTVLRDREAHGAHLLNRRDGLVKIIRALRHGENGAMLFDQNSGRGGVLISFMGRLAAATDLPDILARQAEVKVVILAVARTGFWKGRLIMEELPQSDIPLAVAAHRWLEGYLTNSEHRSDWLWTHKRWGALMSPHNRLGLNHKNILEVPSEKKFRVVGRLPDEAEKVEILKPLLERLRKSRPDMALTLIGRSRYIETMRQAGLCERYIGLPRGFWASVGFCRKLRAEDFDVALDFIGSFRSALELWATGALQRFGFGKVGKPFITDRYIPANKNAPYSEKSEAFLKRFGMRD